MSLPRYAPRLALGLVLTLIAVALSWERSGMSLSIEIEPERVAAFGGEAYATRLPLVSLAGLAFAQRAGETRALLFEDGAPLERRDAPYASVVENGRGRYMSLPRWIVFSSSDGTDPRANGRRYRVALDAGVPLPALGGLAVLAALIAPWAVPKRLFAAAPARSAIVAALFAVVTIWWTLSVITPAPQVVLTGDGGNVASIVAARAQPGRLAEDPVFGDPRHFAFYQTILVPVTLAVSRITQDVGQAYMALSAPFVLVQLIGFHLLGRRLFGGTALPALLALASLAPVYVFSGELWGMLASPLTRSGYATLFPFLLLGALVAGGRALPTLGLMIACGLAVYVHPVSAPSVAFGVLTMCLALKPGTIGWPRHAILMVGCGLAFLAVAAPFALGFAHAFPTGARSPEAMLAQSLLRDAVGRQYYDAPFAMAQLFNKFWWGLAALAAASLVLRRERAFLGLLAFLAGLLTASFGVAWLDQGIGAMRGADPVQIDLIRNIRFVVPVALVAVFWALARLATRGERGRLAVGAGTAATTALWLAFGTPIVSDVRTALLTGPAAAADPFADVRDILAHLAERPAGTVVLPLPHRPASEEVQMVALAVRYGALQPVVFSTKDLNFLSYSTSGALAGWRRDAQDLDRAVADPPRASEILAEVVRRRSVDMLLVGADATDALSAAALNAGKVVMSRGSWRLIEIGSEQ